jgi:hypothetical protein
MRLRLRKADLHELAKLYRLGAADDRRKSEEHAYISTQIALIESAKSKAERAEKIENLAAMSEHFILMGTRPFDGGPPSLLVVGGSDAKDGSSFVTQKAKRA